MKDCHPIMRTEPVFESVIQALDAQEYHEALEALFLINPDSPKVHGIWVRFFREIVRNSLSHVVAFNLGRAILKEMSRTKNPLFVHYLEVLEIMLPKSRVRGLPPFKYFQKEDLAIVCDLIADNLVNSPLFTFKEAHTIAWVLKAGNRTGERNPFRPASKNSRLVFSHMDRVNFSE